MITLLGIAHVINIRKAIERIIRHCEPDIICIELDRQRYEALSSGEISKDVPFLYRMLSNFQKKVADKYGSSVGDEMLTAARMARKMHLPLAFIDVPTSTDGQNILDSLTLKENAGLLASAVGGMFIGKKRIEKELQKFQDRPEFFLDEMEKRFPEIKRQLIDYRDVYMSANIRKLSVKYNHVLAVVGDGHIPGMKKKLAPENPRIIRLVDIRKMMTEDGNLDEVKARELGFPALDELKDTNASANYSFSLEG